MTGKTDDLDEAITSLQEMIKKTRSQKLKLQMIDRLTRMLALKYKHSGERKGGKFTVIPGGKQSA